MVKLDTGAGKAKLPSLSDFFGAAPAPLSVKEVKSSKKIENQADGNGTAPSARLNRNDDVKGNKQSKQGKKGKEEAEVKEEEQGSKRKKTEAKGGNTVRESAEDPPKKKFKKKTDEAAQKEDDEADADGDATQADSEDEEDTGDKNERTIFVGGVPVTATRKDLKKFFKVVGPVESVRMRSMPVENPVLPKKASIAMGKLNTARETCNAYVVFKAVEDAVKALEMHGTTMDGHRLKVDSASGGQQYNSRLSVFIGNLPFNAEEEAVRRHFGSCGEVTNVRLIRDGKSSMGKGFGYVSFADSDQVQQAVALHGSKFGTRALRVYRAARRVKDKEKAPRAEISGAERRLASKGRLGEDKKGPKVDKSKLPKFKKKRLGLNELGQVKGGKKRMREKKLKMEAKKMRKKAGGKPGGKAGGKIGKKPRRA